jgi:hypothetical protein
VIMSSSKLADHNSMIYRFLWSKIFFPKTLGPWKHVHYIGKIWAKDEAYSSRTLSPVQRLLFFLLLWHFSHPLVQGYCVLPNNWLTSTWKMKQVDNSYAITIINNWFIFFVPPLVSTGLMRLMSWFRNLCLPYIFWEVGLRGQLLLLQEFVS